MKSNDGSSQNQNTLSQIKSACATACRNLVSQMNHAREAVLAEFRDGFHIPEHMVKLALNEAEALAWETKYPQLVFADLATEKAQALLAWQRHQEETLNQGGVSALAR